MLIPVLYCTNTYNNEQNVSFYAFDIKMHKMIHFYVDKLSLICIIYNMEVAMEKIYCMVIGDIVNSKSIQIEERSDLQKKLKNILDRINYDYQYSIVSPFTITLGDEFQGGLYDSSKIFDILETIKNEISPHRIRVGIGIEKIRTPIQIKNSFGTDGDSYYGARNNINILKKRKTFEYGYLFFTGNEDEILLNLLFEFVDQVSSKWTEKQIEYIRKINTNESIDSLANRLNVDQSTISRTLKRANYNLVKKTLNEISMYLYNNYSIGERQDEFIRKYNTFIENISKRNLIIDESILINESINPQERITLLTAIAYCYSKQNKCEKAIEYAQMAMSFINSGDYNSMRIRLLNIIAISNLKKGRFQEAIAQLLDALQVISYESDVKYWEFITIGNLAHCYLDCGKYDLAKKSIAEAKNLLENYFSNDYVDIIKMNSLQAKFLFKLGKYEESYSLQKRNLEIARTYLDKSDYSIAVILQSMTKALFEINKNTPSETICLLIEESNSILSKNNRYDGIIENYNILKEYYKAIGNEEMLKKTKNKIEELRGVYDV